MREPDSPYMASKSLDQFMANAPESQPLWGAKTFKENNASCLAVPMRDIKGKLWNIQTIYEDGKKSIADGGRLMGLCHIIGQLHGQKTAFIVEGFATGVTIYEAIRECTIVAFGASNLQAVGEALRSYLPDLRIVVCGDEDRWKLSSRGTPLYTGRAYAREAAEKSHGTICQVQFNNCEKKLLRDKRPTDFNDLLLLFGRERTATQLRAIKSQLAKHLRLAPYPLDFIPTENTGFNNFDPEKVKYHPNPQGLKQYFLRLHPYAAINDSVYLYQNGVYKKTNNQYIRAFAQTHYITNEQESATEHMRREFLGTIKSSMQKDPEWPEHSTKNLINFKNGVLNIKTKKFNPHSPQYGFFNKLSYNYDPEAPTPTAWNKMMTNITQNDPRLAATLQEYIGYCLSGDPIWIHKGLLLLGEGENGKSTFIDVIRLLLGDDACSTVPVDELGNEYSRDMLYGKLANISEENSFKNLNSEALKNLISGGTLIARPIYQQPYAFKNKAKFIISFNELVPTGDKSHGFSRRLLITPFNAIFNKSHPDFDPHILDKIKNELPAIFNLCLDAYQKVKKEKAFTMSQASIDAINEFKYANDPVRQFFNEQSISENDTLWLGPLYTQYKIWCTDTGHKMPLTRMSFVKSIKRILREQKMSIRVQRRTRDGKYEQFIRIKTL